MAKFEVYRFNLSVPTVGPLFEGQLPAEPRLSRRDYLRDVLTKRRDFYYRGKLMVYMPSPPAALEPDRVSGFVGRRAAQQHGAGPERLFAETKTETWRAAFLAADISPGQQIVFFENRIDVGSGRGILEALFEGTSTASKSDAWHVDVDYMWEKDDFWQAATRFRGQITELQFTFAPANGLDGFDEFKKFDRIAKREANAEVSDYSLKNSDAAINPSGEFVESAVEYASEGAGEAVLKSGRRKLFSSRKSRKTEHVHESLMPRQRETTKILGLVSYLFGRRKASDD